MTISRSIVRRTLVTLTVAVLYVFLYETTIRDSRYAARQATIAEATGLPQAGAQLTFTATAYCKGETTASGVVVRTGVAAADPALLPVGTVVRIDLPNSRYSGVWTIMDTGPAVQGRIVDLYLWSCKEALAFGRRPVRLTVLRLGWNPQMSAPGLVDRVFRQRESAAPTAPPAPAATPGDTPSAAPAVPPTPPSPPSP
ncbi:MAG: 3D domain-containing protein [Acidobacteria bacterium]|nr:3D domain-containing protein [Acidobacteriota bacterium]